MKKEEQNGPCEDPFDIKINQNCGLLVPRFYFESAAAECRAVLYGGCPLSSKNVFLLRKVLFFRPDEGMREGRRDRGRESKI